MNLKEISNINFRNKNLQIIEEVVDFHKSVDVGFDNVYYGDNVQMQLDLKILCDNEYITVIYFVLINKYYNEFANSTEDNFSYRKVIYRKSPLSEIKFFKNENLALYIISVIESICNNPIDISKLEFENFNVASIFDIKNKNFEKIQYGIFYLSKEEKNDYPLKNERLIKISNSIYNLKLLPIGNINVYKSDSKIFKTEDEDILSLWNIKTFKKKHLFFSGSFEECFATLNDEKSLLQKFADYKNRNLINFGDLSVDEDWSRNYFDTMTDGNLGDYDDFNGSNDDIDTWSRG